MDFLVQSRKDAASAASVLGPHWGGIVTGRGRSATRRP